MAVTIDHYDHFVELMADGVVDIDTDAHFAALMDSDFAFAADDTVWADAGVSSNQIPAGNGYTQFDGAAAGKQLASVTSGQPSAGVWMFDAADITWTASGGPIPGSGDCTDLVIVDTTPTSPANPLLFAVDFGGAQSAGDGTDFKITWDANGICRIE
jgi:hypothetical protein